MAVHNVIRPNPPAQLQPRPARRRTNARAGSKAGQKSNLNPAELMPVKVSVYRTIAELNAGFEKVAQELQALERVSYFRSESVTAMRQLICRFRAQANRDFTMAMHDREKTNAGYFERLSSR